MIGQIEILKQIDNLIQKGFPRFIIITGQKGQGKTELAIEISHRLKIPFCNIGTKIDDIREMIEMAYKQTEPLIYLIQDADKMSLGAKNSLLKVIEEPPNNAYFIMELQQIENTLETIKSRCQELRLQDYTIFEISEMIDKIKPDLADNEKELIKMIATNYYQIKLFIQYGISELYNYTKKVVNNIYKVQSANSFKIAEKLDLKDDGNGYNIYLFFEIFKYVSWVEAIKVDNEEVFNDTLKTIGITSKYQQKLNITGINKQSVVDCWILDIRKEWLH